MTEVRGQMTDDETEGSVAPFSDFDSAELVAGCFLSPVICLLTTETFWFQILFFGDLDFARDDLFLSVGDLVDYFLGNQIFIVFIHGVINTVIGLPVDFYRIS